MEYGKSINLKPALSSLNFYMYDQKSKQPLIDFSELKIGDTVSIEFTLSGFNLIKGLPPKDTYFTLFIILYDRIKSVGYELVNYWTLDLDALDMNSAYNIFRFPLFEVTESNRSYDFKRVYRELKVLYLDEFSDDVLKKEILVPIMNETQLNEIFSTKIPVYDESVRHNE